MGIARSTYYDRSQVHFDDTVLVQAIASLRPMAGAASGRRCASRGSRPITSGSAD